MNKIDLNYNERNESVVFRDEEELKTEGAFRVILQRLKAFTNQLDTIETQINPPDDDKEKSLAEMMKTLNEQYEQYSHNHLENDIPAIKKMIKHSKNPLEKRKLERILNQAYKNKKKQHIL